MVASVPEQEYICPRLARMWRAHQVVMVPLSELTIASSRSLLLSSWAITCGFMGFSMLVERLLISSHHSFIPSCAFFQEAAVAFAVDERQQLLQCAATIA